MYLSEYKRLMWIKDPDGPIFVKEVDLPGNNMGWLVIDSLGYGSARGGIRMGGNVNLEEVKELAAEMTLKFSFLNLPLGGAKAGIYCPSPLSRQDRDDIFFNFGECLKPLLSDENYLPGTDMGTRQEDIAQLFRGAGIIKNMKRDGIDSGYYTAISVFSALQAVASVHGIELYGARIGIQGLGKVGMNVLRLVVDHGLDPVAVSTRMGALYSPDGLDSEQIFNLAERFGDDFISNYQGARQIQLEEFFEQDMDILCPCADRHPIHPGNMEKVKARVVIPGCNVAATSEVEWGLYKRGIIYLPGFVCNSGGVLGHILKEYGIEEEERSAFLRRGIQSRVTQLLNQANKSGRSPADMARSIARQNQEKFVRESKARPDGKLSRSVARFKTSGLKEILLAALWSFIQRKLPAPPYVRKWLVKKIVFERLFQG